MSLCFHAVGGTAEIRRNRARLLRALDPSLGEGDSRACLPPNSADGAAWRIPDHIPRVLAEGAVDVPEQGEPVRFGESDVVLVIGRVEPGELEMMVGNDDSKGCEVFLMGPGFNYQPREGAGGLPRNANALSEADCLAFSAREWAEEIFPLYPPVLRRLRAFQVGGFWCSRSAEFLKRREDGACICAFYRQFGLCGVIESGRIQAFELSVAEAALHECPQSRALQWLTQGLSLLEPQVPAKSGDEQEVLFRQIYALYDAQRDELCGDGTVLEAFTRVLGRAQAEECAEVEEGGESGFVKEYDGLAAHVLLRKLAGLGGAVPDRQTHLNLVRACLGAESACLPYLEELRMAVRGALEGSQRKLHVLHDLGLDPQSDDWIAICITKQVWPWDKQPP